MTALEKFLKQIALKQVDGSVYLVPAICDFQIQEALEEERKQQCNIGAVSKSFALGKVLGVTDCIYGHQFNTGELVRIIRHDSSSSAGWLCTNTRSEYWLSEREANVC